MGLVLLVRVFTTGLIRESANLVSLPIRSYGMSDLDHSQTFGLMGHKIYYSMSQTFSFFLSNFKNKRRKTEQGGYFDNAATNITRAWSFCDALRDKIQHTVDIGLIQIFQKSHRAGKCKFEKGAEVN